MTPADEMTPSDAGSLPMFAEPGTAISQSQTQDHTQQPHAFQDTASLEFVGSQDVHGPASSVQIGDMVDPVAADNADAAGGGGGGLVFDEIFDD